MQASDVAFFRVEGVLTSRAGNSDAASYLAVRARFAEQKVLALGAAVGARGLALFGGSAASETATRLRWAITRGMTCDRLRVLGDLYAADVADDIARGPGPRLMRAARERGERIVWITDLLDVMIRRAASTFEIAPEDVLCNRVEIRNETSTGRLEDPIAQHFLGGPALRAWCEKHALALERATAFGSSVDDQMLLAAVPRPCAVRPDFALRRVATTFGWPVIDR